MQLLDISLRMLHIRNQPAWKKPFVKGLQNVLRNTPVGGFFFNQACPPNALRLGWCFWTVLRGSFGCTDLQLAA